MLRGVSQNALAAVLLVGRQLAEHWGLPTLTVEAILDATSATRSRAYEVSASIWRVLPTLVRDRGRPASPQATRPAGNDACEAIAMAVIDYLMAHPGCVDRGSARQHYSDGFRQFIIETRSTYHSVELDAFARAARIPLPTLKDWLARPAAPPDPKSDNDKRLCATGATDRQIQTVLHSWSTWEGSFRAFCEHVRSELRVPFGRALIGRILEVYRARKVVRRPTRSPDELALRDSFRTRFPGAQWIGDGMQVPVTIDGQRFNANLELLVDAYSGAFVGLSVREEEDAIAVVEAFTSGLETTGAPPLSVLVDNRPSNHSPEVDAAFGETLRIRATPSRPQNKAHVEGAFGLFSQILPSLTLDTTQGPRALALSLVRIVSEIWARTTNHRPRKNRSGRTRVDLYGDTPSAEQIQQAYHELLELKNTQEKAQQTLASRRDPLLLSLLDQHFDRLQLHDPERHIRVAIAGYPLPCIIDAIAVFDSKRIAGTLPEGADARYLLGIVRNMTTQVEGESLARALMQLRIDARDQMLASLIAERDKTMADPNMIRAIKVAADRALETTSPLDRAFWLEAIADALATLDEPARQSAYLEVARLIQATFAIPPRDRHAAVRSIANRLWPV